MLLINLFKFNYINKNMNLNSIDIFGMQAHIFINSSRIIRTKIGAVLSILLFIFLVIATWLIGNDIVYKKNPFSFQQIELETFAQSIKMNPKTFPIAFYIQDFESKNLEFEGYLTFKFNWSHFKINENGEFYVFNSTQFSYKKCINEDFPVISRDDFISYGLNNYMCIPDYDLELKGNWGEPEVKLLEASVKMCDYEKLSENCKSKNEIENFLNENTVNFGLFYYDVQVIVNDYDNPILKVTTNPYKFLVQNFAKITSYFVQVDKIKTDNGFFSENFIEDSFLKLKEVQTELMASEKSKVLYMFDFYSSNAHNIHYRKYIRVTDIIASIGGVLKVLFVFFEFINFYFADIQKYIEIINSLFKDEEITENVYYTNNQFSILKDKNNSNLNEFQPKTKLGRNTKNKSLLSITSNRNDKFFRKEKMNFKYSHIRKYKKSKYKVINLTFYEKLSLISHKICCISNYDKDKGSKFYLFEEATQKIKFYLDMVNIMKKLEEVHLMKHFLLTEKQRKYLQDYKINLRSL